MRGYAGIALMNPKTTANVGGAMRAAQCLGASFVATIGDRYKRQVTDTMKAWRHLPVMRAQSLKSAVPLDCVPVAVEIANEAFDLTTYVHPERALYVFGPEDGSLGRSVISLCRDVVKIPSRRCLNLAATVNVVLYDRLAKRS